MGLIFKEEVYAMMGAAMDVHRELGSGFLESVYQEALEKELACRKVHFESQKPQKIIYKGETLRKEFFCGLDLFRKNHS
jgi:GxxExxY protein